MKASISLLAVITAITAGAFTAQAARAEGFGSARWTFAPNIYRVEGVRVPPIKEAPHSVRNGSVPSGLLGISPGMLTKPAPVQVPVQQQQQVQTQVSARPTVAQATPQMVAPKFNQSFGKAGSLPTPPMVANNPGITPAAPQAHAQPGTLQPQAKAAPAKALAPSRPLVAHRRSSQNVFGKLNRPKAPEGLVADAGKRIDSYNSGYAPGAFLPAAYNGDGTSTQTQVSGRLVHRNRK